jgi:hypothetical protein
MIIQRHMSLSLSDHGERFTSNRSHPSGCITAAKMPLIMNAAEVPMANIEVIVEALY